MWKKVKFLGVILDAWVPDDDIIDVLWKSGTLKPGQIWAQIADDGPCRPAWPVETEQD